MLRVVAVLLLPLLEGAVAQILLLADHVAELVELGHHVIVVAVVAVRRRHLQIFHHLLELGQELLGGVARAAARHVLQPVEHVFQIALAQHLGIAIERVRFAVVAQLLRQRLHEAVHGGAQLIHELLDFLVAGVALERIAQRLLGIAQRGLRVGHVAVLDVDGHRPQPADHVAQIVVGLGVHQQLGDRAQPEIDAGLGVEFVRRQSERIERGEHPLARIGVERQIAALLDQRPRQRLAENALRQAERERLALADVAAVVMGDERHRHFGAGPRVIGQILDRLPDALLGARLRQDQREIGRTVQRMGASPCGAPSSLRAKVACAAVTP